MNKIEIMRQEREERDQEIREEKQRIAELKQYFAENKWGNFQWKKRKTRKLFKDEQFQLMRPELRREA